MKPVKSEKIEGTKIINEYNSTNIVSSEYDTKTKDLIVTFRTGRKYLYENVANDLVVKMRLSDSIGKFFNINITKTHKYKEVK